MPPLHPAIVHFPIALIVFSFIADLLGRWFDQPRLRAAGFWALVGGVIGGVVAAATGYWDMTRDTLGPTDHYVEFHMDVGWVLLAAAAGLFIWRWLVFARRDLRPGMPYLMAAFLVVCLVLFQGWYGGEMVYSQGAGVAAAAKGTEKPEAGRARLDKVTWSENEENKH